MTKLQKAYVLDEFEKFIAFLLRTNKDMNYYELHTFLLGISENMLIVQEEREADDIRGV